MCKFEGKETKGRNNKYSHKYSRHFHSFDIEEYGKSLSSLFMVAEIKICKEYEMYSHLDLLDLGPWERWLMGKDDV